jgi:hypothetical protein
MVLLENPYACSKFAFGGVRLGMMDAIWLAAKVNCCGYFFVE